MENDDKHLELLTIPEAAIKLRISERTVARLIADGQVDALKIRRRRLISTASLNRLLKPRAA